jgi:hypothetical protein
VSKFFWTRIFLWLHQAAGDYYPFAGTPKSGIQLWNIHMQRDPDSHPASHWSIGSHFWVYADLIRDFIRQTLFRVNYHTHMYEQSHLKNEWCNMSFFAVFIRRSNYRPNDKMIPCYKNNLENNYFHRLGKLLPPRRKRKLYPQRL